MVEQRFLAVMDVASDPDLAVVDGDRQNFVVADDPLCDCLLEGQLVEPFSVARLVVHREHVIVFTAQNPLGRRHEQPGADCAVLVGQEGGKGLPLCAYGLVSLIEDG